MSAIGSTIQTKPHPLQNYVVSQLQSGADEETIIAELGKSGVEESIARNLVQSMRSQQQSTSAAPMAMPGESGSIQGAVLGGLIASLVAGLIWGGIIILTGYEFGIVAWGVGVAVGFGVVVFSKGESGPAQQFCAVAFSIFGILVGKYAAFYSMAKEYAMQELGPETAEQMSFFSMELFGNYLANLPLVLGLFDLLWLGLAVTSAWKITANAE